jgi:hypothetical protein
LRAEFRFTAPRVFLGIDVYNDGPADATLTISSSGASPDSSSENAKLSITLKPGELSRLRTDWKTSSSKVIFDLTNPQSLHFDNLAYQRE